VTIQITLPDDGVDVIVIDSLAGNMEAQDDSAVSVDNSCPQLRYAAWGWWYWSSFDYKEVRKDRVTAYARRLNAGTYSFSYKSLIVTPGVFILPPTKAYLLGQPELMGLSIAGHFDSAGKSVSWESAVSYGADTPLVDVSAPYGGCYKPATIVAVVDVDPPFAPPVETDSPQPTALPVTYQSVDSPWSSSPGAIVLWVILALLGVGVIVGIVFFTMKKKSANSPAFMAMNAQSPSSTVVLKERTSERRRKVRKTGSTRRVSQNSSSSQGTEGSSTSSYPTISMV